MTRSVLAMLLGASVLLSGCEQSYRYPCHNPDNWDSPRCKAPICEVNKDCPSHILPKPTECGVLPAKK